MTRISLSQQLDELADFQVARLAAVRESIRWLAENERIIKQRMSY